jgi:hypothetical protein
LQLYPVLQRANVVTKMQLAGGAHAAQGTRTRFLGYVSHLAGNGGSELVKEQLAICNWQS